MSNAFTPLDSWTACRIGSPPGSAPNTPPPTRTPSVPPRPAVEQAVAVGVLDDVVGADPHGREGPAHDVGPHLHVGGGVGHDDGLAGGAAGGVQANDLIHAAGEQSEGG